MSDGPYRSLPLSKDWKKFAKRLEQDAYDVAEASGALREAIHKDFICEGALEAIETLNQILGADSLFGRDKSITLVELESVRQRFAHSTISAVLFDCAMSEVYQGTVGNEALVNAVQNTVIERFHSQARSMQEHYYRKEGHLSQQKISLESQKAWSQLNLESLTSTLCKRHTRSDTPHDNKKVGVEEGPRL